MRVRDLFLQVLSVIAVLAALFEAFIAWVLNGAAVHGWGRDNFVVRLFG
jgi:hypothetical protein